MAVAFGTQFPDLIDKPLAWTLGVSPSGRAGAHSLLAAIPILIVLWRYLNRRDQYEIWSGFAIGYLAHVASGGIFSALASEFSDLGYLFWPVTDLPDYTESSGILAHFATLTFTPQVIGEFALFALAVIVWMGEGAPGLRSWYR